MRRSALIILVLCATAATTSAQENETLGVRGTIVDAETGFPLEGINAVLSSRSDTTQTRGTVSDSDGAFEVSVLVAGEYQLSVSSVGYASLVVYVSIDRVIVDLGTIRLEPVIIELDPIIITARKPAMEVRGDTLEFSANAYQTPPNAYAEDLVRKLPGIQIVDGNILINGEPVERIMLDGREFFGNDVLLALQTLPLEIISSLQIYDKLSDQAEFTGFDDGDSQKTINIVTRPDRRNGQLGEGYGGMGSESRYRAGFNVNGLADSRRVSLVGRSSNISSRSRGGRPGGGITKTHSLNLNYNDEIGDKLTVSSSYSLGSSNTVGYVLLSRRYFLSDNSSQFYDESNISQRDNANHRIRGKLKYEIDEHNALTFRPNLSFETSTSKANVTGLTMLENLSELNSTVNENYSDNDRIGGSASLLYQHRFKKKGRTISANLSFSAGGEDGYSRLFSEDVFYSGGEENTYTNQMTRREQKSRSAYFRLAYTEPVGENHQVELSYGPSRGMSDSDRIARAWDEASETYLEIKPGLSNQYENLNTKHRAGINYRKRGGTTSITLGIQYEDYSQSGDQTYPYPYDVDQHFRSLIPNARVEYKFSKTGSVRFDYRARTRTPSVAQLQSVIDNSNPIQLSTGNPNLKQSIAHNLYIRYRSTNPESNRSLSGTLSVSTTCNHIGRESTIAEKDMDLGDGILLRTGSRLTRPINMNGLWQVRGSATYSFPVDLIKSNLHLNTSYSHTRSPGFINAIENLSLRHNFGGEVSVRSNISERVDFNVEYSASYNLVDNSVRASQNDNYLRHRVGADVELYPWEQLEFNSRFNLSHYSRADDLDSGTIQWNAGIAYRFLQGDTGEIELSIRDILDQGNSFTRNVNEFYVEDNLSHVLGRYLLLSFTYRVKKFGR